MTLRTPFGLIVVSLSVARYPRPAKGTWGCPECGHRRRWLTSSGRCPNGCGGLYRGSLLAEKSAGNGA